MTAARISEFTNDRARTRFLAAYDSAFDRLWPVQREPVDLPTSFGTARAYRSGQPHGVPVVLLPGGGGNALMWHRYVARLGRDRPVIALDPVGEPGGGSQHRPMVDGGDVARALDEVLSALRIDHAHLVGCSYGGWTALQHDRHHPGRAASLTLLDPGGLAGLNAGFTMWVIAGGLAALTPTTVRRRAARWLHNTTLLDDDLMLLLRATTSFRRRLPWPGRLTDDELSAVTAPTLALLGERSQLYDAARAADRLRALLPAARVEVVAGASHDLPMYCPELIQDRVVDFCARIDANA